MSTKAEELESRIRKIEEVLLIQTAIAALFTKTDEESKDRQRAIRIALGLE